MMENMSCQVSLAMQTCQKNIFQRKLGRLGMVGSMHTGSLSRESAQGATGANTHKALIDMRSTQEGTGMPGGHVVAGKKRKKNGS